MSSLKIRAKFLITMGIGAAIVMALVVAVVANAQRRASQQTSTEQALESAQLVESTLVLLMAENLSRKGHDYIAAVQEDGLVEEIRLLRGPKVVDLIGRGDHWLDPRPEETRVLTSGQGWHDVVSADGHAQVWTITPVVATEGCLTCHSNSEEGDVLAAVSLRASLDEVQALNSRNTNILILAGFVLVGVTLALVWLLLTRMVVAPITATSDRLRDIAEGEGDLTQRLPDHGGDELAVLAGCFNLFMEKLQGSVSKLAHVGHELARATRSLASTASELTENASSLQHSAGSAASTVTQSAASVEATAQAVDRSSEGVSVVASATTEVAATIQEVARSTGEMSFSIESVAAATEEMSASLNEIARNCARAAEASASGEGAARQAQDQMVSLDQAAQQISRVVGIINDIADKTNLLALNATIEAASAGQAGAGFAVVANEVKNLARQTARATEDIKEQVEAMQTEVHAARTRMEQLGGLSEEVNLLSQAIAAAVEEQTATTAEIARSTSAGAQGAQQVSASIGEVAAGIEEMAARSEEVASGTRDAALAADETAQAAAHLQSSIDVVKSASDDAAQQARQVDSESDHLAALAQELEGVVSQFRYE